jgi:hypothetical protein
MRLDQARVGERQAATFARSIVNVVLPLPAR